MARCPRRWDGLAAERAKSAASVGPEWTARHDSAAAKAIAGYDTCCSAFWNPAHPGQIALTYLGPCSASVAPSGRELASTGDCFDSLRITVDVGAGTVVSIVHAKGP